MKVFFRILLILVVVGAIAGATYYLLTNKQLEQKNLLTYLNKNTVAYYTNADKDVTHILSTLDHSSKHIDITHYLPDSSKLNQQFVQNGSIVSWHLTRQGKLTKVYWVLVNEEYDPANDSLLPAEKVNQLYQIKIENDKYFLTQGNIVVAIGNNGEIIEQLTKFDFLGDEKIQDLKEGNVRGSWIKLQRYLHKRSIVFSGIDIEAKHYAFEYYSGSNAIFYTMIFDSVQGLCPGTSTANFNGSLPNSTMAAWQTNFSDNNCLLNKHIKDSEQKLWELEERYQIKVSTIMNAWFDGSFRSIYCDFNGVQSHIAAVKLKDDAAPFASGSRFFVDYDNIHVGKEMPQKSFTIARVIPEGLAQIVFPGVKGNSSLFVTQYKSHLYFAQKREPLVLLLNELITGNSLSMFDQLIEAQHHFFFRFPYIVNFNQNDLSSQHDNVDYLVQGKSLLQRNRLIIQGQIVSE